jgi:hypothetical protein
MPTRFWGVINIAAAANAAHAAASAAADVMGSPAASKAVKILGGMISLPSPFAFFHDLISLPGCEAIVLAIRMPALSTAHRARSFCLDPTLGGG